MESSDLQQKHPSVSLLSATVNPRVDNSPGKTSTETRLGSRGHDTHKPPHPHTLTQHIKKKKKKKKIKAKQVYQFRSPASPTPISSLPQHPYGAEGAFSLTRRSEEILQSAILFDVSQFDVCEADALMSI